VSLSVKVGKSTGTVPADTTQDFEIKPASGEVWDMTRIYAKFSAGDTSVCYLKLILTNGTNEITIKEASGTSEMTITWIKGDTDFPNLVIDNTWYLVIRIINYQSAEKSYEYYYMGVGLS